MTPKVTFEILDMGCLTDVNEVQSALTKELKSTPKERVSVIGSNSRGKKMGIGDLDRQDATRLFETGRIKIGFINCQTDKTAAANAV